MSKLSAGHLEQLAKSGITPETAETAGLYTVTDATIAKELVGTNCPVPALAFPYANGTVRLRPDEPKLVGEGEYESVIKYLSPVGQPTGIYFVPTLTPKLNDRTEPLWIVEGEKKLLAALQAGLTAVALPGVSNWGNSEKAKIARAEGNRDRELHPDLLALVTGGRKVVICFDNDIDSNPNVLLQAVRLGVALRAAGASVYITYLPESSTKVGLDDYYAVEKNLGELEDGVRDFNPQECIEWIQSQRDQWVPSTTRLAVERAARIAMVGFGRDWNGLQRWAKDAAKACGVDHKELHAFIQTLRAEAKAAAIQNQSQSETQRWVEEQLSAMKPAYQYGTGMLTLAGRQIDYRGLMNRLLLAGESSGRRKERITAALDIWLEQQPELVLNQFRAKMTGVAHPDTELRRYVRAVTGDEKELDLAVMKHWLWLVKRKLHGKPVEHHIMPVFFSAKHGSGKTTAINKLLSPLGTLANKPADLSVLADSRENSRLAVYYALFFDEMAYADRVAADTLKNRITSETVSWRPMGTNSTATHTNVASFIGASNRSVQDIIYDPTGMRRIYQVDCLDLLDWSTINGINYDELWASVSENDTAPVITHLPELRECQEELRQMDPVEEFIVEATEDEAIWMQAEDFYQLFRQFHNNRNNMSRQMFFRRVKTLLGDDRSKRANFARLYRVTVRDSMVRGTPFSVAESVTDNASPVSYPS